MHGNCRAKCEQVMPPLNGESDIKPEAINAQKRPLVMFADTAAFAQNQPLTTWDGP